MKHVKQLLTIFLMVGVMFSIGLTAATQNARVIGGDPLRIIVYDDSTMHVEFNDAQCGLHQYNSNSKGSILWVDKVGSEHLRGWAGGYNTFQIYNDLEPIQFMPVSNTLTDLGDSFTVTTIYNAGLTGDIQVTQTVSYNNGDYFYKIEWAITHNGSEAYTGLRFRHGGDTSFMGGEPSIGHWGPGLGMVYLTNDQSTGLMGLYGALGFYGETPSPTDLYTEYLPENVLPYVLSRFDLNQSHYDTNHDAAYALEWKKDSLAPAESWTVTAFERFHCDGPRVEVTGEDGGGLCGTTVPVRFHVANFNPEADTYDLSVISQNGWTVSIQGSNPITIGAADYAVVDVDLTIPFPAYTPDVVTLTATSQTDGVITDSAGATIYVTCEGGGGCAEGVKALIVYPNGGEIFDLGDEITIVWTDENVPEPKDGLVRISLWKYESGVYTKVGRIAENIPVTQEAVVWTISQVWDSEIQSMIDVEPGATYVVKIREKGRGCHDYSDAVFTINPDPNPGGCPDGDKALVTAPTGEAYSIGDDMTIEWSAFNVPPGDPERLKISLWQYNPNVPGPEPYSKVGRIVDNVDVRQEIFLWENFTEVFLSEINSMINVVPGERYVIKIREKDRGCHHYSPEFNILPPPNPSALCPQGVKAELTFPNNGETLAVGQQITITWNNGPAPLGLVRLSLWANVSGAFVQVGRIAEDVSAADGSYSWIINQVYDSETTSWISVEPGAYLLKIREKGGPTSEYRRCHDYSDQWVTITDVVPQ